MKTKIQYNLMVFAVILIFVYYYYVNSISCVISGSIPMNYSDKTVNSSSKIVSYNEKLLDHSDKIVSNGEKTVSFSDKIANYSGKLINYSGKAVNYSNSTMNFNYKTVNHLNISVSYSDNLIKDSNETGKYSNKAIKGSDKHVNSSSKTVENCFKNVVTVISGGRTGNLILEYASVWGFSKKFGLKPYVPDEIRNELDKIFTGLGIPQISEMQKLNCSVDYNYLQNLTISDKELFPLENIVNKAKYHSQPVVLRRWIQLYEVILPYIKEIKENFVYRPEIIARAQKKLHNVQFSMQLNGSNQQILFVGIHIRRTDYGIYLDRRGIRVHADVGYYQRAVAWMDSILREEHHRTIDIAYVVVSDDTTWCQKTLIPQLQKDLNNSNFAAGRSDILYVGNHDDAVFDMVILSSCNHSIISYGTYGAWSALMAGGWTVYYDVSVYNKGGKVQILTMHIAETLHNWRPLV